jgi:pimeloyl-ACP methyl ester carboxylesterase
MKLKEITLTGIILGLSLFFALPQGFTQPGHQLRVENVGVQVSATVSGLLYRPARPGRRSSTAVLDMHDSSDFTHHFACEGLASRGYQVLCANGRYVNLTQTEVWDNLALDVGAAVTFLRQQPGVQKVVLLGHSGGGALMAWYQNVAENGVGICQDANKLTPCGNALAGLPPADGVVLIDPVAGIAYTRLVAFDPVVTAAADDQFGRVDPTKFDSTVDMFSPANGYSQTNPNYSPTFVQNFYKAQGARMNGLIALAESRQAEIQAGVGLYPDNEPFTVGRNAAQLFSDDTQLIEHTKAAHTLLTAQGPQQTIIHSIRPLGISVVGDLKTADSLYGQGQGLAGALKSNVTAFLSSYAIRVGTDFRLTEDDVLGVDWPSANSSTPSNLAYVRAPLLLMSATGHYWVVTTEIAYNMAASTDKSLAYVYGATHGFTPCTACKTDPSLLGDTTNITLDYIAEWLTDHFGRR